MQHTKSGHDLCIQLPAARMADTALLGRAGNAFR